MNDKIKFNSLDENEINVYNIIILMKIIVIISLLKSSSNRNYKFNWDQLIISTIIPLYKIDPIDEW